MWGYVVVLAAFMVYLPVAGFVNSFGVFVDRFDEVFCQPDECLEILALISALALANFRLLCSFSVTLESTVPNSVLFISGFILCVSSMFFTSLIGDLYSLFITHSILFGLGSTLMLNSPMSLIESYFPKSHPRHVLATSIVNLGPPLGVVVMNPLAVYLDKHEVHDWRDTMRLFGLFMAVSGILYMIVTLVAHIQTGRAKKIPQGSTNSEVQYEDLDAGDEAKQTTCGTVCNYFTARVTSNEEANMFVGFHRWVTCRTIMWLVAIFLVSVALFIPKTHFIRYMLSLNITEERAAMVMSFSGLSEAATSLLISFTGDTMLHHIVGVYMGGAAVLAIGNLLLVHAYTEGHCAIYVIVHGAVDGLLMTVLFSVVSYVTPLQAYKKGLWAASNFCIGVGQIAGLPIAGILFDRYLSYGPAFYMSCTVFGISSLLFGVIYFTTQKEPDPEKTAILAEKDPKPIEPAGNTQETPTQANTNAASTVSEDNQTSSQESAS